MTLTRLIFAEIGIAIFCFAMWRVEKALKEVQAIKKPSSPKLGNDKAPRS